MRVYTSRIVVVILNLFFNQHDIGKQMKIVTWSQELFNSQESSDAVLVHCMGDLCRKYDSYLN